MKNFALQTEPTSCSLVPMPHFYPKEHVKEDGAQVQHQIANGIKFRSGVGRHAQDEPEVEKCTLQFLHFKITIANCKQKQ